MDFAASRLSYVGQLRWPLIQPAAQCFGGDSSTMTFNKAKFCCCNAGPAFTSDAKPCPFCRYRAFPRVEQ